MLDTVEGARIIQRVVRAWIQEHALSLPAGAQQSLRDRVTAEVLRLEVQAAKRDCDE